MGTHLDGPKVFVGYEVTVGSSMDGQTSDVPDTAAQYMNSLGSGTPSGSKPSTWLVVFFWALGAIGQFHGRVNAMIAGACTSLKPWTLADTADSAMQHNFGVTPKKCLSRPLTLRETVINMSRRDNFSGCFAPITRIQRSTLLLLQQASQHAVVRWIRA